jgi:hypothetical protein
MQQYSVGDLVLVINSIYHPYLIGHAGIVVQCTGNFSGYDKYGRFVSGAFTVVDLPGDVNRHGTTLWFFKPHHIIRISPDESVNTANYDSIFNGRDKIIQNRFNVTLNCVAGSVINTPIRTE